MLEKPIERLQFRVLYRVFLLRVVDLELLSAQGDVVKLLGQFAALLAAISFLFTAPLILVGGRLPQEALWTMEHVLIATTMVVVGLFSVLSWDSIFPDRRDVLVLAPLPVHARTLFLAKLGASLTALSVSILALNIFTGLVWPFLFSPANGGGLAAIRSLAAYWITMLVAGAFIFCSGLGVHWFAAQLLPRQQFLRLSAWLQVAAVCLFLSVYFLEPSLETPQALAAPENQRLLAWLPSYWFLGLFQQLNGSMDSSFVQLAMRARTGLAVAVLGSGAAVMLSYFRTLRKIVEEPDILPGSRHMKLSPRFANSLQSAIVLFSVRTLLRSRHHRVIFSLYLGIGFAIVLAYLKPVLSPHYFPHVAATAQVTVPLMTASILMMCVVVTGTRIVFSMPIALHANWIFRVSEVRKIPAYLTAIRRTLLLLACLPVWVVFAMLFLSIWPLRIAVGHLVVLGLLGIIFTDVCVHGFKKIPFTCSYLPGKGNIQFVFWACVILLPLTYAAARLEWQALQNLASYVFVIAVLSIVAVWARWRTAASATSTESLTFDEAPPVEILALGLRTDKEMLVEQS